MSYEAYKVIHLFGVMLFLGNIIVTGVWKVFADRTGDPRIVAFAQHLVTVTDWVFTFGGVIILGIGAYGMAGTAAVQIDRSSWLFWGQILFIASGVIWVVILIPIQIIQARQARAFANGGEIPASYWRYGRQWAIWGIIATLLPLANIYVMVFKP